MPLGDLPEDDPLRLEADDLARKHAKRVGLSQAAMNARLSSERRRLYIGETKKQGSSNRVAVHHAQPDPTSILDEPTPAEFVKKIFGITFVTSNDEAIDGFDFETAPPSFNITIPSDFFRKEEEVKFTDITQA